MAVDLASQIAAMGPFELLTEGKELPVFAFKLKDSVTGYSVFDVSERLRSRGWLVPVYTLPRQPGADCGAADRDQERLQQDLAGLFARRHPRAGENPGVVSRAAAPLQAGKPR